MNKLILVIISLLLTLNAFGYGSYGSPTFQQYPNNEAMQGVIIGGKEVVYHTADISSSVDAFSAKTNKYAESPIVRVIAQTKGVHVLWGNSSIGSVDGDDYLVLANTVTDFAVDPAKPYLRVIQESGTAEVYVVEIY